MDDILGTPENENEFNLMCHLVIDQIVALERYLIDEKKDEPTMWPLYALTKARESINLVRVSV